jgi:Spy/CpxP family protein refolding chaperone
MRTVIKTTTLAITLAALLPLAGTPAALADNKPLIDKEFEYALNKHISRRFCSRINASDEQREKIAALFAATMEQSRPLREEVRSGLLDLSALAASDAATDEQITRKVADLRAVREKIANERLSAALKLRKILTHDQRKQMHDRVTELLTGSFTAHRISMLMNQ